MTVPPGVPRQGSTRHHGDGSFSICHENTPASKHHSKEGKSVYLLIKGLSGKKEEHDICMARADRITVSSLEIKKKNFFLFTLYCFFPLNNITQ